MKTAVVLLNLGGPLQEADIRPFLFNFFMDENIIAAPLPLRRAIAAWISVTRARGAARESYGRLNYKSPLLDNTRAQAVALEKELGPGARVFVAMRYWHPRADDVAKEVKAFAPDEIVLLPLYPQYSTATVKSSLEDWARAAKGAGLDAPTREIPGWHRNEGFIAASAENIRPLLRPDARLLFSAHGLPEKTIRAGDPYQAQCEESAALIAQKLGVPGLDWKICYQSRVGPLKWIGPSIGDSLEEAARDKKGVVIYPHAFVSEHVETLVELDIEYREKAEHLGLPFFLRAPTAGTHPAFIAGLAREIKTSGLAREVKSGQNRDTRKQEA